VARRSAAGKMTGAARALCGCLGGMRIVRLDVSDRAATQACYEVVRAALVAEDPFGPPTSARTLRGRLEHPHDPIEAWYVPGETGDDVLGWYYLELPALENLDRASLRLFVHPSRRRRGIGGELLRHAAERAAAHGRSVLIIGATQGSAGEAFAARARSVPGLLDARRVLVLDKIPPGRVAALRAEAARVAAGYALVSWAGRTPDEYVAGYAAMHAAMNDAPRDPGEEPQVWDAQRVRERIDNSRALLGRHMYTLAALEVATGEMAAVTEVETDPENPGWGHQQITAVARPHRGHRLGMLVKAAMLDWLATAEPTMARIVTGNAAVNGYMIAINEALGYELLDPKVQFYELAVADALAFA
jgi:GNAT superfamily N-acetyltransferase/RimJ/RimL family protein N-acetyltransferase